MGRAGGGGGLGCVEGHWEAKKQREKGAGNIVGRVGTFKGKLT